MNKLIFTFFFVLISLFSFSQKDTTSALLKSFHSISSHEILKYATELSSDKYKGRLSGSPEYLKAAQWAADKFKTWEIKPANKGSYFQYFNNAYTKVSSPGKIIWHGLTNSGNDQELFFPDDFFPGSNSASGAITGELVYIGFGITAPELNWDDYKDVDVQGKIVMMETGLPYSKNDTALSKWNTYAYHRYKFKNAKKHGALGLVYVSKIANPNTSHIDNFIYSHIDKLIAEKMFALANQSYEDYKKIMISNFKPASFKMNQSITISANTKHFPESKSCNVVGMIEGSDPELKKEVIIIGGHLDAVGYLGKTFPGALDNASGVSDILGAAKTLVNSEIKPKRSVLFILFGGEECGLYGSKKYIENPIFPVKKTICMINLDMVGNGTGFFLSNGRSYPELYQHFTISNDHFLHRDMKASTFKKNYGRPRSDASVFESAGFTTFSLWTSGTVKKVYYHHPLDNTDGLTPEIMEDAAKLLYLSVLKIANDTNIKPE